MFRSLAFSALGFLLLSSAAEARKVEPPANRQGLPVIDARGQRMLYGHELDARGTMAAEADAPLLPPSGVTARWGYAGFGSGIGLSDIVLADGEIYAGGSITTFGPNDYWYVLRSRGTGYEQVFVSRALPGLVGIGVADVRGDARKEIVIAQANGSVVLFDQRSREEIATMAVGATGVAGMTLRDLDGDGKAEILVTTSGGNTLYVLSGTGAVLWQRAASGGVDVVVGNMDADPSLEIATTSGVVLDFDSRTLQWQRAQGFGIDVEVADIDGDGKDELIAAQDWDFVWAFDVDTQLPKWSIPIFDIGAIWVGNVDADPEIELLVGEGQWGKVRAFNTVTQAEEWFITNPEHGVTDVVVGDPNGNGVRDVLWGAGATSTGSDRLYVANLATKTIDWENVQMEGPFLPPQSGDVDGDGFLDIVTASWESESGYDSGRIVVLDGATLRVKAISPPVVANLSFEGIHDLRLRNVDADPQLEIVIGADRLYDGVIEIYDFSPAGVFTLKWTNTTRPSGAPFYSIDVADIDGDGQLEVVGGTGKAHTGSLGTFVYAYSYPGGTEDWHTFALTTGWLPIDGLIVLNAGGGVADIVAMVGTESLNYFNGAGQPQAIVPGPYRFIGPDASTSARSFLSGDSVGTLRQHLRTGPSYIVTWTRNLGGSAVEGVTYLSGGQMTVASGGRLTFFPQRNAPSSWLSEDYGVHGVTMIGNGVNHRPFVGGKYAIVALAPWLTLIDVQPSTGPSIGGTLVTATGTAFQPGAQLYIGAQSALGTQVPDTTHATGTTPVMQSCTRLAVTVTNPDMSFEILDDGFTALRPGNNWNRCTVLQTIADDDDSSAPTEEGWTPFSGR